MRRSAVLALALGLAAAPAWAQKEWYDYYLKARDELIPDGKCAEALKSLEAAVRIKPLPALNEQTYGLQFVDYLPYYYQGVCYLKMEDLNSAVRFFNIEEDKQAIRKSPLYRDLLRQRAEAGNLQQQQVARQARADMERLLRESADLAKARKFEAALAKLAEAELLARGLDPATQRTIVDRRERIRADEKDLAEIAGRAQRLEQALADGTRLLDEGKPTEAMKRFEDALSLDQKSARALEGRNAAQERILAFTTSQEREAAFQRGKALFQSGAYEKALGPLTDAAADPANATARDYLERARKIVQGTQRQKELQGQIDDLLARGERQLGEGHFSEAQVSFEGVLRLDPGHAKAKERRAAAERLSGEALLAKYLQNQDPLLTILEPQALEIDGPTVVVVGAASDDRGMARVEFRIEGALVGTQRLPAGLPPGEARRSLSFRQPISLAKGRNEITITAFDDNGGSRPVSLIVMRRPRVYETQYFIPSVLAMSVGLIGAGFSVQRARRRRAVRRRFNPYIAGAPIIDDHMFFGRQKLLTRILNVLHHNSLMITGERRIGKTTFLYHLKKVLAEDEGTEYQFFPVLIDLQGVPETGFFYALMSDLVEGLTLPTPAREALRFRPGLERYDGRDFSHDLQRVIEALKPRTERKVKLALLIDEVDVLNEYSESVNQRLRSIFMKTFSENLVAVMSGVGIKRIWKSEGSPWYNFFDEVEISNFTREEAEDLVKTPVEGFFRYQPKALEMILSLSQLKPYVIQKFCVHAVNRMLEEGRSTVTVDDVQAVEKMVLLEGRGEEAGTYAPAPVSA
jgi:hypothetical protein